MSKLKITPDIAELMGTYMEGGFLTSEELQIVHSVMNEDFMSITWTLIPSSTTPNSLPYPL